MNRLLKLTLLGGLGAGMLTGQAQVLLLLDVSDPLAVKITTTSNAPLTSEINLTTLFDGVTLLGFFTSLPIATSGSLGASSSLLPMLNVPPAYDSWATDESGLNLYRDDQGTSPSQIFDSAVRAFTGQATVNLAGLPLPSAGDQGDIKTGFGVDPEPTILGQWQVIPEPETWGMVSLALLGVAGVIFRRRRQS